MSPTGMITDRIFSAGLIVALLAGALVGGLGVRTYYRPLLAEANAKAASLDTANQALAASIQKQNQAVDELKAAAKKREQAAHEAVKSAHSEAEKQFRSASGILMEKPPVGANKCEAARDAFAGELRDERGLK